MKNSRLTFLVYVIWFWSSVFSQNIEYTKRQAENLHNQAIKEHENGRDSTAYILTTKSIAILDSIGENETHFFAEFEHDAGMFALLGMKNLNLFSAHMQEAIALKEFIYGKNKDYYWSIECYADGFQYLSDMNGFPKNIEMIEKAISLYEDIPNHGLLGAYRQALNNLAVFYEHVNVKKSITICEKLLDIERKYEVGDTLLTLSNLADFYKDIDCNKALQYAKVVLFTRENSFPLDYEKIRLAHHRIAAVYCRGENLMKAIYHSEKALELAKCTHGAFSEEYATSLQNLSTYCLLKGDTLKSLDYMKQAYSLPCKDKVATAHNIALIYSLYNMPDSCCKYAEESWKTFFSDFVYNIYQMSKENRFSYICTDVNYGTVIEPIKLMLNHEDHPGLKHIAFNSALSSKDILQKCMRDDGEVDLDYWNGFKKVKNSLREGEVAIEIWENKHEIYMEEGEILVFIIRKDYDTPRLTRLSKEKLYKTLRNEYPTSKTSLPLYDNIWKDIIESAQLHYEERIYIAPDGLLASLPIEQIIGYDGMYMNDIYDIIRLTSLSEIPETRQEKTIENAVLYGGLKYDSDINTIVHESLAIYEGKRSIKENLFAEMSDSIHAEFRSTTKYLPWTKIEVDSIYSLLLESLNEKAINVYEGELGIEETIKSLSGQSPSILHIATHGYIGRPNEKMDLWEIYKYCMENSGLLFSGVLNTNKINDNSLIVEDGILRSSEITLMDLRNTSLLVLSACNTGIGGATPLGDIGLLRAFKAAGVGSILMTLGDVDDAATYMMLTTFYRYLVQGSSKREALRKAQKLLRESEELNSFEYWGNFIIID